MSEGTLVNQETPPCPTGDWRDQRYAMEKAYLDLGVVRDDPNVPESEWKLVEATLKHYPPLVSWHCQHCQTKLNVYDMIRCADCKVVFCTHCIYPHFKGDNKCSK